MLEGRKYYKVRAQGHLSTAQSEPVRSVLTVFKTPNGFLLLSEITLTDIPLDDFDITLLHHLPRLERLYLGNTGVGNEAYLLRR